uniref:uncharacterized protein LOC114672322 n=1 Tax=Macaca mulatta TaxID=9544 RepID=UPI0010A239FB
TLGYHRQPKQYLPFQTPTWARETSQGYLRWCGLPIYVDRPKKGAPSAELARKVFLGGAGNARVSPRYFLPRRLLLGARAPPAGGPRESLAGEPGARFPRQPPSHQPRRPPWGRGSPARGRGRRAIGLCAEPRGGTSAGRQTRAADGGGGGVPAAHKSGLTFWGGGLGAGALGRRTWGRLTTRSSPPGDTGARPGSQKVDKRPRGGWKRKGMSQVTSLAEEQVRDPVLTSGLVTFRAASPGRGRDVANCSFYLGSPEGGG